MRRQCGDNALGSPTRPAAADAVLEAGTAMTFAGDTAPCAYVEQNNIGALSGDRPASISAALCKLLEQRLGVSAERTSITVEDVPARLRGWNGGTFG